MSGVDQPAAAERKSPIDENVPPIAPGDLSLKENFDAFMQLAAHHEARINIRRDQRWKLSLALWAMLLAPIATIHDRPNEILIAAALAGAAIAHVTLLAGFVARDQASRDLRDHYLRSAEHLLKQLPSASVRPGGERMPFIELAAVIFTTRQYLAWFQFALTLAFAALVWMTLGAGLVDK